MANKASLDRTARRLLRVLVGVVVLIVGWLVARNSVGTTHTVALVVEAIGFVLGASGAIPMLRTRLGVG